MYFCERNTLIRFLTSTILFILFLLWLHSVSTLLVISSVPAPNNTAIVAASGLTAPTWRDALVLDITAQDVGVQLRRGTLSWCQSGPRQFSVPLRLIADGRAHRLVIPVGTHPNWAAPITNMRLNLPEPPGLSVTISGVSLVRRPPWALDALLARGLAPLIPEVPPWPGHLLLCGGLLAGALALAWPRGALVSRWAVAALTLGAVSGLLTLALALDQLRVMWPIYAPLDETTAATYVPAYDQSAQLNQVLAVADRQLPNLPVLVLSADPEGYLVYRARYVLYPRQVDVINPIGGAVRVRQAVARDGYGAILAPADGRPPLPGWRQAEPTERSLALWVAPTMQLRAAGAALPPVTPWLLIPGLALVGLAGWAAARALRLPGALQLAGAWPLGSSLLALWMTALAWMAIPWSWLSVGAPLLGLSALLRWTARQSPGPPQDSPPGARRWALLALLGGLLLIALVAAQALLLPFSDQDTWRMWAFKGRAFFHDGALAPLLTRYAQSDMLHPDYPPAQPLMQTWGYLAMGGISERLVKLIFPLWYGSLLASVWAGCRAWVGRWHACAWAGLLATTPLVLDHATLGNADLPLAASLALAAILLAHWIDTGATGWLSAGAVVCIGAAWIKLDGLYLGLLLIGLATLTRLWGRSPAPRRIVGMGALAAVGLVTATLPWRLYARALGLRDATPGLDRIWSSGWRLLGDGLQVMGGELLFSYNNAAWGLLGGGFGVLWLVSVGTLLVRWRQVVADPVVHYLVLATGGGMALYVAIYVLHPYFSIERYLLHLAPLAILAAARTCSPQAARAASERLQGRQTRPAHLRRRWHGNTHESMLR